MKIKIKNCGDRIRLRNLVAYKVFRNSTKINRFINYRLPEKKLKDYEISFIIDVSKIDKSLIGKDALYIGKMVMENRFDLLGSGWVRYSTDDRAGKSGETDKTLGICWNKDIRTGYEWPGGYLDEVSCIASPEGVDIKNVWELGRMNYLMPFALYVITTEGKDRQEAISKYKKIIEDFDEKNPAGQGVNWIMPMEASIRISNILMSYDLVLQADDSKTLDGTFAERMGRLAYAHIKFIWNNLEKNIFDGRNGNHYYSDIVGLIISTGYLKKRNQFVDRLFHFARDEFFRETLEQFYEEGGHFEQSSGYFRLTGEMAVFVAAMLVRLGCDIPEEIVSRLVANRNLANDLRKTDGSYYSFGDCDSGRYIKTRCYGRYMTNFEAESFYENLEGYSGTYGMDEDYFLEDDVSLDSLIKYTDGLLGGTTDRSIEGNIISLIAGERAIRLSNSNVVAVVGKAEGGGKQIYAALNCYPYKKTMRISTCAEDALLERKDDAAANVSQWMSKLYEGMGLYILRKGNFSLLFRIGSDSSTGHSHNDTLHFEYEKNGKCSHIDPGTYTYTGYPDKRNAYRSEAVHNVPHYGREQRRFKGLFGYASGDKREIVEHTARSIAVRYTSGSLDHVRRISFEGEEVLVEDYGMSSFDACCEKYIKRSPAYGVIEREFCR